MDKPKLPQGERVIQISGTPQTEQAVSCLYALTNYGRIFKYSVYEVSTQKYVWEWRVLPEIEELQAND